MAAWSTHLFFGIHRWSSAALSQGILEFMETDAERLTQKVYNLAAISFTPGELAQEIRKHVPGFKVQYVPDFRQGIAQNWPRRLDDHIVSYFA